MAAGTIKWFSDDKGFGSSRPTTSPRIYRPPLSDRQAGYRSLTEGANVCYEAGARDKGPKAVNIQPIS